jgi:hypothetical protein
MYTQRRVQHTSDGRRGAGGRRGSGEAGETDGSGDESEHLEQGMKSWGEREGGS